MADPGKFVERTLAIRGKVTFSCTAFCRPDTPLGDGRYFFWSELPATYGDHVLSGTLLDIDLMGGPMCCPAYDVPMGLDGTSAQEIVAIGHFRFDDERGRFQMETREVCTPGEPPAAPLRAAR